MTFVRLLAALMLYCIVLEPPMLQAQHFLNDVNGAIMNTETGIIRLRSNNGEIRNTQASITNLHNNGVIECTGKRNTFTGFTPAVSWGNNHQWRIGGLVKFLPLLEQPIDTQMIPARYYSNLECAGISYKHLADGIHIGGDSEAAILPRGSGVFRTSGGARIYNGTLFFDNAATQNIPGNEPYHAIEIQRASRPDAVKRIGYGVMVTTATTFRQSAHAQTANLAGLQVLGTLTIGTKGDFPAMPGGKGGEITITGGGTMITGSDSTQFGVPRVTISAGSLIAAIPESFVVIHTGCTVVAGENAALSTFGTLVLMPKTTMVVHGEVQNAVGSKRNLFFHENSTVVYDANTPQKILSTIKSHPYGHLIARHSEKQPDNLSNEGNIIIAGNLIVTGATIDLTANPGASLTLINPRASVLYGPGIEEVRGLMIRHLSTTQDSVVFNNAYTWFQRSSGQMPLTMSFDNRGSTAPRRYQPTTDVQRLIDWAWTGSSGWQGIIQIAYNQYDIVRPFEPLYETRLSLFEQFTTNSRLLGGIGFQRQVVGNGYWGFIRLGGIQSIDSILKPSLLQVISGRSLLLRADLLPVVSIADGRWSNPLTWSAGREPDEYDSVSIFHNVHVGFRRWGIDGKLPEGQIREQAANTAQLRPLARSLYLGTPPSPQQQGALIIASIGENESAFADEQAPISGVWYLTKEQCWIHSGKTFFNADEILRQVFMHQQRGLRYNTHTTYQGLMVIQPHLTDTTRIQMKSLLNDGILLNAGILEIRE